MHGFLHCLPGGKKKSKPKFQELFNIDTAAYVVFQGAGEEKCLLLSFQQSKPLIIAGLTPFMHKAMGWISLRWLSLNL
jgi:hypothetical protein